MTEQCPACGRSIPYGNGAQHQGERWHFWCAIADRDANRQIVEDASETRMPNGTYV